MNNPTFASLALSRSLPLSLALMTLLAAACDSPSNDDDALVGSFTRLRDGTTEMRDRFAFGADGTFAFDENKPTDPAAEDHLTGTFTAEDGVGVVTATNAKDGERARVTFSYYANRFGLYQAAFRPAGAHTGFVGTWKGVLKIESLDRPGEAPGGASATFEVRADRTFQRVVSAHDGSAARTVDGTWAAGAGGQITLTDASGGASTLLIVDDAALVYPTDVWHRD
jgi:hypothetical protein